MIGETFYIKENDTRPRYVVGLLDNYGQQDEGPIDLTSATAVKFLMRALDAAEDEAPKVTDSTHCVITDAANGLVTYTWQSGDTDHDGDFQVEFEITWNDGGKETVPNNDYFPVTVKEDLG